VQPGRVPGDQEFLPASMAYAQHAAALRSTRPSLKVVARARGLDVSDRNCQERDGLGDLDHALSRSRSKHGLTLHGSSQVIEAASVNLPLRCLQDEADASS
jgi:hypothetical protein